MMSTKYTESLVTLQKYWKTHLIHHIQAQIILPWKWSFPQIITKCAPNIFLESHRAIIAVKQNILKNLQMAKLTV